MKIMGLLKTTLPFILAIITILTLLSTQTIRADGGWEKWEQFGQSKNAQIIKVWLACRLQEQFKQASCAPEPNVTTPSFYGQYGVFVTLLSQGKVRGCFGSFSPSSNNFGAVLDDYLRGALRRDPRYKPLDITEVPHVQIIITLAGAEHQVDDLDAVDTASYGVTVTSTSNEKIVFVPAELRNIAFLKNKLAGKDAYQVSVFRALTIK